jgi:hypothetical protein
MRSATEYANAKRRGGESAQSEFIRAGIEEAAQKYSFGVKGASYPGTQGFPQRVTPGSQQWATATGDAASPQPIPFTWGLPARFAPGQTAGNVMCIDRFTARITLSPPMRLAEEMSAYLHSASIPITYPNIGPASAVIPGFPAGNNRISITWPGVNGGVRTDYLLPTGLYGTTELQAYLNFLAGTEQAEGGLQVTASVVSQLFTILSNQATQTINIVMNPAVITAPVAGQFPVGSIDFLNPGANGLNDSIGPILGYPTAGPGATLTFPAGQTFPEDFPAPSPANLALYAAYVAVLSPVSGSYSNGATGQLLYTFSLGGQDVVPNGITAFEPNLPYLVSVDSGTYSVIDFSLQDDQGNRLVLENFTGPMTLSVMFSRYKKSGAAY